MEAVLPRVAAFAGNWHAMSLVSKGLARRRLCKAWLGVHFDRWMDFTTRYPEHLKNLVPGLYLRMLATGAENLHRPLPRDQKILYTRTAWRAPFYHAVLRSPRMVTPRARTLVRNARCHHAFRLTYYEVVLCRRRAFTALALIY